MMMEIRRKSDLPTSLKLEKERSSAADPKLERGLIPADRFLVLKLQVRVVVIKARDPMAQVVVFLVERATKLKLEAKVVQARDLLVLETVLLM
jgi:hypothetical protein